MVIGVIVLSFRAPDDSRSARGSPGERLMISCGRAADSRSQRAAQADHAGAQRLRDRQAATHAHARAERKVELLLQLIRGEKKLVDVCREQDLKQSEVEAWMDRS